jgi:hypothetical protein
MSSARSRVRKAALACLSVLDVTALSRVQLDRAEKLFDVLATKELLPLHQIESDPIRKKLDTRFAVEVLALPPAVTAPSGPLELLRMKLAREPSVRRGKP